MIKHGKKLLRLLIGTILIVVGLVLSMPLVPGPGVAVIILGLSVLSTEFEFARRIMKRIKEGVRHVIRRGHGPGTAL